MSRSNGKPWPAVAALLLTSACAHAPAAPHVPQQPATVSAMTRLDEAIRNRIAQAHGATIAVSLIDLATGRELHINGDTVFHAASTMKVPVLLELYRRADMQPGFLDQKIAVVNSFKSIADTSHYTLDAGDDSDSSVYKLIGDSVTVRYLAERMIVRSSNLATNLLIGLVGPDNIATTLARAGANGMRVLRGVEDIPAFQKGMNNTTTSRGLAAALEAIARCTVTQPKSCSEMVDILSKQEFNEMIPAGLPAGTKVAHKTGWITGVQHDGAIVYPPGRAPYVLVVLTKGITDTAIAAQTVADISRVVWQTITDPAWLHPDVNLTGDAAALAALQQQYLVDGLGKRRFTHDAYWSAVEPYMRAPLVREQLGQSAEGRPIYLVRYGNGPVKVLLWSQMHGDESTATMALADLMHYMQQGDDARLKSWAEHLTILMIPMMNPDGAEWFVRENAFGIDVNRDARMLATPEARILKAAHDKYLPQFGFNLHDQNARTRVGETPALAAIALLAPAPDSSGHVGEVQERAKKLAALVRDAIEPFVAGHIAKYDDAHNPRAFGDLMQRWGTSTILIESGGWNDDPEKQYLRTVNFAALTTAFDAIAADAVSHGDVARYESLPTNGSRAVDLLIKGGTVVVPGLAPYRADISVNAANEFSGSIVEIGDLTGVVARDTLDVSGLYLHPDRFMLRRSATSNTQLRLTPGFMPQMTVRRGQDELSDAVYIITGAKVSKLGQSELQPPGQPHNAVGCYTLDVGSFDVPEVNVRDHGLPKQIRLLWVNGTDAFERGRALVRTLPGQPESRFRFMVWQPVAADSIKVRFGTGFEGLDMVLHRTDTGWSGTADMTSDAVVVGRPWPKAPVTLTRIGC